MTKRGRLTSRVIGYNDGVVVLLVGQVGQELITGPCGVDGTECRNETGEACVVQDFHEASKVG